MPKKSLKQQAYDTIKEKIITCEYAPSMDLNEAFLLQNTGLSHTPVRDALSRLDQERLVTIMPKKGVRVSNLTTSDINMVYEIRNLIEPYIIRRYGERISKTALVEIREAFEDIKTRDTTVPEELQYLYAVDEKFHQQVVQSSGNIYMTLAMEHIYNQNARLRALTRNDRERLSLSPSEHIHMIDLLLECRYEEAAAAMEQHLWNFKEISFQAVIQNGGRLTV